MTRQRVLRQRRIEGALWLCVARMTWRYGAGDPGSTLIAMARTSRRVAGQHCSRCSMSSGNAPSPSTQNTNALGAAIATDRAASASIAVILPTNRAAVGRLAAFSADRCASLRAGHWLKRTIATSTAQPCPAAVTMPGKAQVKGATASAPIGRDPVVTFSYGRARRARRATRRRRRPLPTPQPKL